MLFKMFRKWKTPINTAVVLSILFLIYTAFTSKIDIEDCKIDVRNFRPLEKSIFYHETSSRGFLDGREACAIESAARTHPNWQINVLFTSPINATFRKQIEDIYNQLPNIKLREIDLIDYARDTPAWSIIEDGRLNNSKWRVSHTSDVLRYITLYRWGGVYLDLDLIMVKSLEKLSNNWAVWESKFTVAAGALSFSGDKIGRRFANATITELASSFTGKRWGHNGPGVITRVLKKICSTKNILKMTAKKCSGFNVYEAKYFYPIKWQQAKRYFKPNNNITDAYGYHVWNKMSHNYKIEKNSPYDKLAKKFCPSVYNSGTLS